MPYRYVLGTGRARIVPKWGKQRAHFSNQNRPLGFTRDGICVFILKLWTSPKADGHYMLTDIVTPCHRCVPSLRQGHKSKNETRIALRNTDWSSRIHFLIISGK